VPDARPVRLATHPRLNAGNRAAVWRRVWPPSAAVPNLRRRSGVFMDREW